MAQTAVEWLVHQLNTRQKPLDNSQIDELFDQAKEMEKEQIEEAYVDGFLDGGENIYNIGIYYNKKYTNGL
jgi:hypothetical protein